MKTRIKAIAPKLKKTAAAVGIGAVLALSGAPAAFAQATDIDTAIASAQSSATTTIGKFTQPLLTVAAAGVAIGVGVKYVKKFRGAA